MHVDQGALLKVFPVLPHHPSLCSKSTASLTRMALNSLYPNMGNLTLVIPYPCHITSFSQPQLLPLLFCPIRTPTTINILVSHQPNSESASVPPCSIWIFVICWSFLLVFVVVFPSRMAVFLLCSYQVPTEYAWGSPHFQKLIVILALKNLLFFSRRLN